MTNQPYVQVAAVVNQGNLLPDQYVLQVSILSAVYISGSSVRQLSSWKASRDCASHPEMHILWADLLAV